MRIFMLRAFERFASKERITNDVLKSVAALMKAGIGNADLGGFHQGSEYRVPARENPADIAYCFFIAKTTVYSLLTVSPSRTRQISTGVN